MRQAVFSYKERNKNPSSCAPLYTNLYYIKTRNSPLKKERKKHIYNIQKTLYCFYLFRQCE